MAETKSRFFSVMVVGDNPTDIMEKYNINKEGQPFIKYKYLDAKKYKDSAIKVLEQLIENHDKIGLNGFTKELLEERLKRLKELSIFEYYRELTDGLFYDENGNALSTENKNGQWVTCRIGKHFALPLKLKNGEEKYSAFNKDIDWNAMHQTNQNIYKRAWEMVMENSEPSNSEEEKIFQAMKDKQQYFSNFKDKDAYVNYSTSYWNYAYVDEKKGWIDVNESNNENEWINNFYDRFVKPLNDDDLVTIFECTTNNG